MISITFLANQLLERLYSLDWSIYGAAVILVVNFAVVCLFRFLVPCILFEVLEKLFPKFFDSKRIQEKKNSFGQKRHEIKYSLYSCISYAIILLVVEFMLHRRLANIYFEIKSMEFLIYSILCLPVVLLLHDCYFFWIHKLLHTKFFYKNVHRIHHVSSNPTIWAMQSLHPVESFMQGLFVPLVLYLLPWHPVVFFVYLNLLTYFDVVAHSGFEFRKFRYIPKWISSFVTSASFHNFHHSNPKYHYGLLTRIWDNLFESSHQKYEEMISTRS